MKPHSWIIGTASALGLLGLAATSGLVLLAHRFVDELSRPHQLLDKALLTWEVPAARPEPPLSQQRPLMFRAADGPLLCGEFWAQSQAAPTVVICHGYRVTRVELRPVAALHYAFGYNVFLFDFRGHGESESVATSGGSAEVADLETALTVAAQQPETLSGKIILHGFSMGAAIALLTPPHPQVAAIIADSPYAHLDTILRRIVQWRLTADSAAWIPALHGLRQVFPALSWATVATSTAVFRLRFGHALIAHPRNSFKRWQALRNAGSVADVPAKTVPPILLIHGVADELVPLSHAHQLVAAAQKHKVPLEVYFVEHARHCEAYKQNPQQYISVLQQFVAHQLGDDFLLYQERKAMLPP